MCGLGTCGKVHYSPHKVEGVGHANKPRVRASGVGLGRRARLGPHTEDVRSSLEITREAAFWAASHNGFTSDTQISN